MNATISLNSVTPADVPFSGLGHVAVSGGRKPVSHQRARFTVDADQRCCTAGLIEQVPDLSKIADALLAQQRVHVRDGQAGPGKFTILDLASGDKDPGRMVNDAGDPAMPPGERHKPVHDQEGDKRDRADGERRRRRHHGPADDRADGDGDREVERAELGKRASLSKPQTDDGHRKHQDRLDCYPAETARLADQFQQPLHPLRLSPARVCRARFAFRLPGGLAVGILKTAISAQERRCTHIEVPSSAGLAGRLTPHREALSPATAEAEEQDNGQPASPRSESRRPRRKCSTRSDGVQHTRGGDPWSARSGRPAPQPPDCPVAEESMCRHWPDARHGRALDTRRRES